MAYPKGDEEALFSLGDAWNKAASQLENLEPELRSVTGKVPQYYVGDGATKISEEFATLFDGKDYSIQKLVSNLHSLGHDTRATATTIEYTKMQEEAFALLTLWTVGSLMVSLYGEVLVPAYLAIAREGLAVFAESMMKRIAALASRAALESLAKPMSKEIVVPLAKRIAPAALQIGKGAAIATGMGVGLDASIQAIQLGMGHRDDGFDLKQTFTTGIEWGVGGLASGPGHMLADAALKRALPGLSTRLGGVVSSGVGGLSGAFGMYGAGLGVQFYDKGNWHDVDKSLSPQMLAGGLAMGGLDGVKAGVKEHGGASSTGDPGGSLAKGVPADVQTKLTPDTNPAHESPAAATDTSARENGQQPAKSDLATDTEHRAAPTNTTPQAVDQSRSAPVDHSRPADTTGRTTDAPARPADTGTKVADNGTRPLTPSDRPGESVTPKDATPARPTAESPARAANVAPVDQKSNLVAGAQDKPAPAPTARTPEGRAAEPSVRAEPAAQPAATRPVDVAPTRTDVPTDNGTPTRATPSDTAPRTDHPEPIADRSPTDGRPGTPDQSANPSEPQNGKPQDPGTQPLSGDHRTPKEDPSSTGPDHPSEHDKSEPDAPALIVTPMQHPGTERPLEVRNRIDKVTGVESDPTIAKAKAEFEDFYKEQNAEAAKPTDVTPRDGGSPTSAPAYEARRFSYGPDEKLTTLTIKVRLDEIDSVPPEHLREIVDQLHSASDRAFNTGERLLSGDRLRVELEFVDNPTDAHLKATVGNPHENADPHVLNRDTPSDVLAERLREHLGLSKDDHPLTDIDLRHISNDIAHANTDNALAGLPETRTIGPRRLDNLEHAQYQWDVEDALRDGDRFLVGADPRTNPYGKLINDGGPHVDVRRYNCLDQSLSALSSFYGDPQVGLPRFDDKLPNGEFNALGEHRGLNRARYWLGAHELGWPLNSSTPVVDQFAWLHDHISQRGELSAALVVNTWHARDANGNLLYEPDGTPALDGSHATVVVYPRGASGPVWWDPQVGTMSDKPPLDMQLGSASLSFTAIDPNGGITGAGATHQGTGGGVPPTGSHLPAEPGSQHLPDRVRMGLLDAADSSGAGRSEADSGNGGLLHSERSDGSGDGLRQRETPDHLGRDVRPIDSDRRADGGGRTDLSAPLETEHPTDTGGSDRDRVSGNRGVPGRTAGTDHGTPADREQGNPELSDERGRNPGTSPAGDGLGDRQPTARDLAGAPDPRVLDDPASHPAPLRDVDHYLTESRLSEALARADEHGLTTTIDGVETPVSDVIRDRLPQHSDLAQAVRDSPFLERSLLERPKALAAVLLHPEEGVPILRDALGRVAERGPEACVSDPIDIVETPLTPEQRAVSAEVRDSLSDKGIADERQPGFDPKRRNDPEYQREFLQKQYDLWPETQRALNDLVSDIAGDAGEPGWRTEPKDEARAWDKIREYKGDVSQLTDLVGAKIVFDRVSDVYNALEKIAADPRVEIVSFKDRFASPQPSGYRDLQMKVRMPNGHIAELRVHLSHVDEVAVHEHALYEVRRDLEALAEQEGRLATPEESALQAELQRHYNEQFWEATKKGLAEELGGENGRRPNELEPDPIKREPGADPERSTPAHPEDIVSEREPGRVKDKPVPEDVHPVDHVESREEPPTREPKSEEEPAKLRDESPKQTVEPAADTNGKGAPPEGSEPVQPTDKVDGKPDTPLTGHPETTPVLERPQQVTEARTEPPVEHSARAAEIVSTTNHPAEKPSASGKPEPEASHPDTTPSGDDSREMATHYKGNSRMEGGQISFDELSPKAKHLVNALAEAEHIPLRPGEVNADHLAELQQFSGYEHAIVQNKDGDLRLFRGKQTSSKIPEDLAGYRFILHTHPEDRLPGPPSEHERRLGFNTDSMRTDVENKKSTHIEAVVSRDGQVRFFTDEGVLDLPPGEYPRGGPLNDRGYVVPVDGLETHPAVGGPPQRNISPHTPDGGEPHATHPGDHQTKGETPAKVDQYVDEALALHSDELPVIEQHDGATAVDSLCKWLEITDPAQRQALTDIYQASHDHIAPFIVKVADDMLTSLKAQVAENPNLKVVFVGRDGHSLATAMTHLDPQFVHDHGHEVTLSRAVVETAVQDLENNSGHRFPEIDEFRGAASKVRPESIEDAYHRLTEYFRDLGIPVGEPGSEIALVDTSYKGTVQELLSAVYPETRFEGHYMFFAESPADAHPGTKQGYALDLDAGRSNKGLPVRELPADPSLTFSHQDALGSIEEIMHGPLDSPRGIGPDGLPEQQLQRHDTDPLEGLNPDTIHERFTDPLVREAAKRIALVPVAQIAHRIAEMRAAGLDPRPVLQAGHDNYVEQIRSWIGNDGRVDPDLHDVLDSFVRRGDKAQVRQLADLIEQAGLHPDEAAQLWRDYTNSGLDAVDKKAFVEQVSERLTGPENPENVRAIHLGDAHDTPHEHSQPDPVEAKPDVTSHPTKLTPELRDNFEELRNSTKQVVKAFGDPARADELPQLRQEMATRFDDLGLRNPETQSNAWRLFHEHDSELADYLANYSHDLLPPSEEAPARSHTEPKTTAEHDVPGEALSYDPHETDAEPSSEEKFRRFENNDNGREYGETELGPIRDALPHDELESLRSYSWNSSVNDLLRMENPQHELDKQANALLQRDAMKEVFGGRFAPDADKLEAHVNRPDLSEEQRAAIERNRELLDEILNDPYRQGVLESIWKDASHYEKMQRQLGGEPTLDSIRNYVATLDRATSQPVPENLVAVRSIKSVEFMRGQDGELLGGRDPMQLEGTVQTDEGYLSTTLGATPPGSPRYVLELEIPEGTPAVWLGRESSYPWEGELLVGRQTPYVITDVIAEPTGSNAAGADYLIKAKLLPNNRELGPAWVDAVESKQHSPLKPEPAEPEVKTGETEAKPAEEGVQPVAEESPTPTRPEPKSAEHANEGAGRPHVDSDRPATLTQHLKNRLEELRGHINDIFAAHSDLARTAELPRLRVKLGDLVDKLGLRDQQNWETPWRLFDQHDAALAKYLQQNHEHLLPSLEDLAAVHGKSSPEAAGHETSEQPHTEEQAANQTAEPHDEHSNDNPHTDDRDAQADNAIPDADRTATELTHDEQSAIHRYTDPDADVFSDLNHRLRNELELDPAQQKLAADIASGLERLPAYDGTVWRGTHLTPEQLARYVPGAKVTEAAFTSSSRDPRRIFTSNVEFIVHSESGRDISAISARPGEQEVLFKPGTTFEVRGVIEDPNSGLFGKTRVFLYESSEHAPIRETPADRSGHEDLSGDRGTENAPGHDNPHRDPHSDRPGTEHLATETDAGVSFHPDDTALSDLAGLIPEDPHHFTADVHIDKDGNAHINGKVYTPEEFGDLLRQSGWDGSKPIRLVGCDAGANGFAARLAAHLDVDVLALTKPAWSDTQGRLYTSTAESHPDGTRRPRIPPDGEWETHHPDGTKTRAADDGFAPGTHDEHKNDLDPVGARDRHIDDHAQEVRDAARLRTGGRDSLTSGSPARELTRADVEHIERIEGLRDDLNRPGVDPTATKAKLRTELEDAGVLREGKEVLRNDGPAMQRRALMTEAGLDVNAVADDTGLRRPPPARTDNEGLPLRGEHADPDAVPRRDVTFTEVDAIVPDKLIHALEKFGVSREVAVQYIVDNHNDRSRQRYLPDLEGLARQYGIPHGDVLVIDLYTTKLYYEDLNRRLRTDTDVDSVAELQQAVNDSLSKLPPATVPELYRSLSVQPGELPAFLAKYTKGAVIDWEAFSSVASEVDGTWWGTPRENILFKIRGGVAYDISDFADGLHYKDPPNRGRELLLPGGMVVRIENVTPHVFPDKTTGHIIELQIVGSTGPTTTATP
ncbi:ADP-ribosyltransferase [Nocardia sp. NPDC059091]